MTQAHKSCWQAFPSEVAAIRISEINLLKKPPMISPVRSQKPRVTYGLTPYVEHARQWVTWLTETGDLAK